MQKTMRHAQQDLAKQHQQSKKQAIRFIKSQLLLTVAISLLLLLFDMVKAYSALTGGLIATTANAWFAYKVFRVSPESAAEIMLASAYIGEIYKIILIGALFLSAFILIRPVSAGVLLISFFVVYMSPVVVSLLSEGTGQKVNEIDVNKNTGNGAGDTERENDG
ncbi:MAG: ATP synthase subunit I [Proteobacteria bacterium]|nr:ATP synthase subunit I [Pseudomonadota bacterium]